MNKFWKGSALCVGLLLAVALGVWAGRATMVPALPDDDAQPASLWVEVIDGSVGRTLPYSTTVRQPSRIIATNSLSGVVTSTGEGEAQVGSELYRVGNTPVRAVRTPVPMWRDLGRDMRGEDVQALQEMLTQLNYFDGESSGIFGSTTEAAVKAWQRDEGRARTGTVALGELVAFPQLPAAFTLGEGIALGRSVAGGEDAVKAPTGQREFLLVLSGEQAAMVPAEATVEITYQDHRWQAVVGERVDTESGAVEVHLVGAEGADVCGQDCDSLPADESLTLRSQVIVVPRVTGPAVPVAALSVAADGTATVETRQGLVDVEVLGSGQGLAIVEGVTPGEQVRLPDEAGTETDRDGSEAPTEEPSAEEEDS